MAARTSLNALVQPSARVAHLVDGAATQRLTAQQMPGVRAPSVRAPLRAISRQTERAAPTARPVSAQGSATAAHQVVTVAAQTVTVGRAVSLVSENVLLPTATYPRTGPAARTARHARVQASAIAAHPMASVAAPRLIAEQVASLASAPVMAEQRECRRTALAARTASLAKDPDLGTAVRRAATAVHPRRTVELDAKQALVLATLGQEACQLMVLVARMGKPVRVPALESVVHPAVSAVPLLPTAAPVARPVLVIAIRVLEAYQLTVCVGRMGRRVRGQQALGTVVHQPGFAAQLLHTAALVKVARQPMVTAS